MAHPPIDFEVRDRDVDTKAPAASTTTLSETAMHSARRLRHWFDHVVRLPPPVMVPIR
jgi:hypothetical protein